MHNMPYMEAQIFKWGTVEKHANLAWGYFNVELVVESRLAFHMTNFQMVLDTYYI